MTPLRQRMMEDMKVRNFSFNTQLSYLQQVYGFANYFHRFARETLGPDEIRAYQVHVTTNANSLRGPSASSPPHCAFFTRSRSNATGSTRKSRFPKKPYKLPVILSREEVVHFLESIASVKHRTILMTAYAAGLRCPRPRGSRSPISTANA